jgi:hypothetical protein
MYIVAITFTRISCPVFSRTKSIIFSSLLIPCSEKRLISIGTITSVEAIRELNVRSPRLGGQSMIM